MLTNLIIFYAHCPIREVLLTLSVRQKKKIKIISATHERETEKGVPKALFYTNAGEKNKRDGDARSTQPLKIQHSRRSGPVAACSVTSAAAARSPSPPLGLAGIVRPEDDGPCSRSVS